MLLSIRWHQVTYLQPDDYEASAIAVPQIVGAQTARLEDGRFHANLRTFQGPGILFDRAIVLGWSALDIRWGADCLGLQSYQGYRNLVWRSPQQTLHQVPLPLLLVPGQEYHVQTSYRDILMAYFSYPSLLTEVAIAREGVVSPTLFLAQGRPRARLQCRRILEEMSTELEVGLTESSLVLLKRALITTVAHHWNPDERSFESSHRHVTLALDWMQLHLNQPFPWSQLCREVGVSQRCLEVSFQRELQMSPNRWLKQERLRGLRQLLLDGDRCTGVPMAQLFESCGLPYCGTSQRAYNRLYGETPVHTRHRMNRAV